MNAFLSSLFVPILIEVGYIFIFFLFIYVWLLRNLEIHKEKIFARCIVLKTSKDFYAIYVWLI